MLAQRPPPPRVRTLNKGLGISQLMHSHGLLNQAGPMARDDAVGGNWSGLCVSLAKAGLTCVAPPLPIPQHAATPQSILVAASPFLLLSKAPIHHALTKYKKGDVTSSSPSLTDSLWPTSIASVVGLKPPRDARD